MFVQRQAAEDTASGSDESWGSDDDDDDEDGVPPRGLECVVS